MSGDQRDPAALDHEQIDPALAELAEASGVSTTYAGWRGERTPASVEGIVAILRALDVDIDGPGGIPAALQQVRDRPWRRMLPPYVVMRAGVPHWVRVHVPEGQPVTVWIECDGGAYGGTMRRSVRQLMVWVAPHEVDGALIGEATFEIPPDLPLGWHTVHASSGDRRAQTPLAVTPEALPLPGTRMWGFMVQLYSLRSRASSGIGDLHDLADLATWSGGDLGADLLLVNPLHAVAPVTPMEASPYFPASRRYVNPLYLRIADIPEADGLDDPTPRLPLGAIVDRDAVWALKLPVLERAYAAEATTARREAFTRFRAAEAQALADFATWCALAEEHGERWREWPAHLRDPRSSAVEQYRRDHVDRVGFHAWCQWIAREQLAAVRAASEAAGQRVGVVHDLAVGVSPDGADAWALQHVLADGVTLGAPPDAFNQQGQNWALPPWHPGRLADDGLAAYRDLMRVAVRHGGGLRVDHIIGLFRQWWIPNGAQASDGVYVRLDHEALIGVLALEAHLAGALLIGEDLGVVEPWVRDYLDERGIPGTSVLWFEHGDDAGRPGGGPLPPERWRPAALATVTTHDMPPTAGWLRGEHLQLRRGLGLLDLPYADERAGFEAELRGWVDALRERGLLGPDADPDTDPQAVVVALHEYLGRTPSRLVGVALTDVTGDRRTQNLPGTVDVYPNWRVPLAGPDGEPVWVDDVVTLPMAARLARAVAGDPRDVVARGSVKVTP